MYVYTYRYIYKSQIILKNQGESSHKKKKKKTQEPREELSILLIIQHSPKAANHSFKPHWCMMFTHWGEYDGYIE